MHTYYRIFLIVPLVLAIIGATVPALRDIGIFQVATAAMFAGAVPYLCFIAFALYWSIKNKDGNHTKAFTHSPLVFSVFCFVHGIVQANIHSTESLDLLVALRVAATFMVAGFVVSAVYSWSALGIWWLFSKVPKTH